MTRALTLLGLIFGGCAGPATIRVPAQPTQAFPSPWGAEMNQSEPEPESAELDDASEPQPPADGRRYDNADPG